MGRKFKIKKIILSGLCLFIVFNLSACVKRVVTIESDPPGAAVFFNNETKEKGTTPCTFDFSFYGRFALKLVKQGYEDLNTAVYLKAPLYEYFPIDLFSEALLPAHLSDKHYQAYKLTAIKQQEE